MFSLIFFGHFPCFPCAVGTLKQAILPFIDYASFMLNSCNLGCKKDLQILQNNALRIYVRYKMVDHVTIDRLHAEANLQRLEQRRIFQLLQLLYDCSIKNDYLKSTRNRTRAEAKYRVNARLNF